MLIFKPLAQNRVLVVEQHMFGKSQSLCVSTQEAATMYQFCKDNGVSYVVENEQLHRARFAEFRVATILFILMFMTIIMFILTIPFMPGSIMKSLIFLGIDFGLGIGILISIMTQKRMITNNQNVHMYQNAKYMRSNFFDNIGPYSPGMYISMLPLLFNKSEFGCMKVRKTSMMIRNVLLIGIAIGLLIWQGGSLMSGGNILLLIMAFPLIFGSLVYGGSQMTSDWFMAPEVRV